MRIAPRLIESKLIRGFMAEGLYLVSLSSMSSYIGELLRYYDSNVVNEFFSKDPKEVDNELKRLLEKVKSYFKDGKVEIEVEGLESSRNN